MQSQFNVYHDAHALGVARLVGRRVYYTTDPTSYAWFEARDQAWLADFRSVVYRLCRSVGHTSPLSIAEDEDSGIRVERIS